MIVLGIIPGPRHPTDLASFFEPMLAEFKRLNDGVQAWDGYRKEWFTLTASIFQVNGDQPAVASMMGMKDPRGKHPYRFYDIYGIRMGMGYYFPFNLSLDISYHLQ